MSTVLSVSAPAAGAKARATPQLCAAPNTFKHYRRSTTSKAPRKRTFLLTMTKFNAELSTPPGVASVFANNVGMLSVGPCYDEDAAFFGGNGSGFGGGNNNNGKNNGGNGNNNGNNDANGDGDGPAWGRFAPVLSHAFLGALAIVAAAAAFPAQSRAMMPSHPHGATSPASSSPASSLLGGMSASGASSPKDALLSSSAPPRGGGFGGFPTSSEVPAFGRSSSPSGNGGSSRPRSKVLHVPCKGSTLVVPLTGDAKAAAPRLGPFQRAKVVDAPIVLSGNEAAVLNLPQYRVRESMLV